MTHLFGRILTNNKYAFKQSSCMKNCLQYNIKLGKHKVQKHMGLSHKRLDSKKKKKKLELKTITQLKSGQKIWWHFTKEVMQMADKQ